MQLYARGMVVYLATGALAGIDSYEFRPREWAAVPPTPPFLTTRDKDATGEMHVASKGKMSDP
jgi:hypothetical protein